MRKRTVEQALRILEAAEQKILEGWVRGQLAVNADGRCADPGSESAVAWCAIGAIVSVPPGHRAYKDLAEQALSNTIRDHDATTIVAFNDHRAKSKSQVAARFRWAQKRLRRILDEMEH